MKYAVDRIENNIVVLENIDTCEIIEIDKNNLPENIHEGSIIVNDNNKYIIDEITEEEKRQSLRNRLDKLKNL